MTNNETDKQDLICELLSKSDDEIMRDAVEEYGSQKAVDEITRLMKIQINNTIEICELKKKLNTRPEPAPLPENVQEAIDYIKTFVRVSYKNGNHEEIINKDLVSYISDLERAALQAPVEQVDVAFNWSVGFPQENGMYLVELHDGEHLVTYYTHTPRYDTWGDKSRTGWTCLTGSRANVKKWVKTENLKQPDAQQEE